MGNPNEFRLQTACICRFSCIYGAYTDRCVNDETWIHGCRSVLLKKRLFAVGNGLRFTYDLWVIQIAMDFVWLDYGNVCYCIVMRERGLPLIDLEKSISLYQEHYQACFWAIWRPDHHCEKTQIEMVWAHDKINKTCKDDPTGHGTRRD